MSQVSLVYQAPQVQTTIGTITLDALLEESTSLSSRVTEYAVEDGAPITDHVSLESEQLSLSGWVTGADFFGNSGPAKMVEAKDALRSLHTERQPITIVTGMDTYIDMVMESCKISRDNSGQFFQVACEFRKIRKVVLRMADVPVAKVSPQDAGGKTKEKAGQTRQSAGRVSGGAATPQQQQGAAAATRSSSSLFDIFN